MSNDNILEKTPPERMARTISYFTPMCLQHCFSLVFWIQSEIKFICAYWCIFLWSLLGEVTPDGADDPTWCWGLNPGLPHAEFALSLVCNSSNSRVKTISPNLSVTHASIFLRGLFILGEVSGIVKFLQSMLCCSLIQRLGMGVLKAGCAQWSSWQGLKTTWDSEDQTRVQSYFFYYLSGPITTISEISLMVRSVYTSWLKALSEFPSFWSH